MSEEEVIQLLAVGGKNKGAETRVSEPLKLPTSTPILPSPPRPPNPALPA